MESLALTSDDAPKLALSTPELITVLRSSLYPGASEDSIKMVLSYCAAAKLDPMQKPVHIVPMWNKKTGREDNVIMPGIGLYRTQASRSGQLAGIDEPEFGEDVTEGIGGAEITYPKWCKVTVRRRLPSGDIATFTAKELWRENYAVRGGKERSIAPNAMWAKRPYGQIAKCAQAQALRQAFPEMCSAPTAEEMEGKSLDERPVSARVVGAVQDPFAATATSASVQGADLEIESGGIELEPVHWSELLPDEWRNARYPSGVGGTIGDLADGPNGDRDCGALWRENLDHPALCAWASLYVDSKRRLAGITWDAMADVLGLPDNPEDMSGAQLMEARNWIAKQTKGGAK